MNSTIDTVLEQKIADIKKGANVYATGQVRLVREYILEVTGLEGAA